MFTLVRKDAAMTPSRGANDPTVAAGHLRWRTMNAEQRREAIIEAIVELTDSKGFPPLRGELAAHCGMDLKTIRRYLRELIETGEVEEPGGTGSRTLRKVVKAPKPRKATKKTAKG